MRAAAKAGDVAGAQITNALMKIGSMVTAAFAVDSIVRFGAEAIKAAADIGKFADQAGLTVQQFEGLDNALRSAHVPTEQLAQGFAVFSRNISDLQRGTGPFLDFLRRAAPQLVEQFRAVKDTADAFGLLTDAVNALGDRQDRVRLLTAAGAEQFAKLANAMSQGRAAIEESERSFQGLGETGVRSAQQIQDKYDELSRGLSLFAQRIVVDVASAWEKQNEPLTNYEANVRRIGELEAMLADRFIAFTGRRAQVQTELNQLIDAQVRLLGQAYASADRQAQALSQPRTVDAFKLQQDAIKAAQGELSLFMARLQTLPPQTEFISSNFAAAWQRMAAVMRATGETESAIAAARINMLRQEDQQRTQTLGNAMMADEQLAKRGQELAQARANNLISETEYQRALNVARSEYNQAQITELQSLGVTLTFQEQYQLAIEKTNVALATGKITAEQAARAHQAAAATAAAAWLGAAGNIAGSLAQAFPKQKAFAVAAAVINVAEGITKALSLPFPLNWLQAAAVAAAGLAQINAIKSAQPGGTSSAPSVNGGAASAGAGDTGPQQAPQLVTINLAPGRYSRDEVVALMSQFNDAIADGAVLKVQ
jgi:hypothetical protein